VFGVYAPVRSVPIGRGMAYAKTHRVPWAPSAPGRRPIDGGVSRSRFSLRFSVCDQDGAERGESDRNGDPLTRPRAGRIPRRRGWNGPPEPFRDHRRGWRGAVTFCDSCGQEKLCYAGQALRASHTPPIHGACEPNQRAQESECAGVVRGARRSTRDPLVPARRLTIAPFIGSLFSPDRLAVSCAAGFVTV